MLNRKAIFARIGYMHYYCGVQKGDEKPKRGGKYNDASLGHELYNFKAVNENLFGYFQPFSKGDDYDATINIERIDPSQHESDYIDNVLVVFVATLTDYGQVIVGWYRNARAYREYQEPQEDMLRGEYSYNLQAKAKYAALLPESYRKYRIPKGKGCFGRANVVYLFEDNGKERDILSHKFRWIKDAIDFIDNYDGPSLLTDPTGDVEKEIEDLVEGHHAGQSGQGFNISPKLRKKIEEYAVEKAIRYFRKRKYKVENVGHIKSYDLECSKDGDSLRVEVKGTQTSGDSVILTPNEVRNAQTHNTALYILSSINVAAKGKGFRLSGGDERVIHPWDVGAEGKLKPLSYMYYLNNATG